MQISGRWVVPVMIAAALVSTPAIGAAQPPGRVASSVHVSTSPGGGGTTTEFTSLSVRAIPAGATLVVTCDGDVCPFRSKSIDYAVAQPEVQLAALFGKSKLPVGTTIVVRVTKPNTIGKVFEWTVQRSKQPTLTTRCLRPGADKPTAC